MNCERAQAALSARMDGERTADRFASVVDEHAVGCPSCRTFEAGAVRVRTAVRIRPAEPIPDLVGPIMARIAAEPRVRRRLRRPPAVAPRNRARRLTPVLAATIAGLMAGSVVVGGPWQGPSNRPIAAAAVVLDVQRAAPSLDAFAGTFDITERGLSPSVPVQHLRMDVAFRAPQRFRMDVHDLTTYPSPSWTPTNLTFISDGASTYRSGPTGCPASLPAGGCPPTRTTITRASAYSAQAPAPADLILPLTTFASADGIGVLGTGRVAGRPAVEVQLTFARAQPLFPYLQLGGNWRPFFDQDRVDLWLDRTSWFPLRYSVYPSTDPARRAWELRFGMPIEASTASILDVQLTSFDRETARRLALHRSRVGPATRAAVGGIPQPRRVPPGDAHVARQPRAVLGRRAAQRRPERATVGPALHQRDVVRAGRRTPRLARTHVVRPGERYRATGGSVERRGGVLRAGGRRARAPTRDPRLGNEPLPGIQPASGATPAAGGVTSRYEASRCRTRGRRCRGRGISIEQVAPADALARSPCPSCCRRPLPAGYVLVSASILSGRPGPTAVNFVFRQRESDTAGGPMLLHVQMGDALPPASSAHQLLVDLDATSARWTPDRDQLEWIRDGAYVSLQGPLGLDAMLQLASQVSVGAGGVAP